MNFYKKVSAFFPPNPTTSEVFFIRGYAKSGTNWLSNLVNLHPDITCKGEFHLSTLFKSLEEMEADQWSLLNQESPDLLKEAFHQFIKGLIIKSCKNAVLCGDRTPHTLRETYIPNVKNIYITRDGRDAIISFAYHAFNIELIHRSDMKNKLKLFKTDPNYFEKNKQQLLDNEKFVRNFSRYWNNHVLDDFRMIAASKKGENKLDYMWVRYEDLHKQTDIIRKEIYRYLGVKPNRAKPLDDLTTPGFKHKNNRSFFRSGQAGIWKEYFTKEQLSWFMEEASEALALIQKKTVNSF